MNENIAFSPIEAEKLNKKVRDTLAEHLFVLCNITPTLLWYSVRMQDLCRRH